MTRLVSLLKIFCLALIGDLILATSPSAAPSAIRSSQNSIVTIAGTGTGSSTGTGGVATAMTLNNPEGVWLSSMGTVYVVEGNGYCVRKFSYPNGIVFSVAGVSGSSGSSGDNGPATSALLILPYGIVVDTLGVVYIADWSNKVRMVSVSGIIATIAGTGTASNAGDNGPASSAAVYRPVGLWMDSLYQLYVVSCDGHTVRRIGSDVNRIISTIVGTGTNSFSGDGGPATSATLFFPNSVFVDSVGVLYIGDSINNRVRRVTTGGIISTVIGTGSTSYNGDQPGTSCNLNTPLGVVVDPSNGDIYVASANNYLVRVMAASSGVVSDFAGNQNIAYSGESVAATSAGVRPRFLFLDTNSHLFISDDNNNRVRMTYPTNPTMMPTTVSPSVSPSVIPSLVPSVSPSSVRPSVSPSVSSTTASPSTIRSSKNSIITIAGTGAASSTGTGGVATAMTLNNPEGVWLSSIGTVYIVEYNGHCVRKFSYPNGIVFSVAGVPGSSGSSGDNGPATSALLSYPYGVAVDTLGVVYIVAYNKVRMVSVSGIITTIAGTGTNSNTGDNGPASSAALYGPIGVWMDSLYQLYVVSYDGHTVRRIGSDVNRIISTIAGTGTNSFSGDGGPATRATLSHPYTVFVDSVGVFYIGDGSNNRVRIVTAGGIISTVIGTGSTAYNGDQPGTSCNLNNPIGVVVDPSNGDIYVAALNNYLVRVLTGSSGIVSVFAGNQNSAYSGESVPATSAGVIPYFLILDTNSRLFITDYNNNRVRMTYPTSPTMVPTVSPSVAPSLRPTQLPSVVPSTLPSLIPTCIPSISPSCIPSVGSSTLIPSIMPSVGPSVGPSVTPSVMPSVSPSVSPTTASPSMIRSFQNSIITIAGTGAASSTGTGGVATAMTLNTPLGVWLSSIGTVYVVEGNGYCVRKFSYPNGIVVSVAGVPGSSGSSGDNGPATSALLSNPNGIAVDTVGVVYIADYNNQKVRMVSVSGIITTIAGTGTASNTGDNGPASSAALYGPIGVWMDSLFQLYVVSNNGHTVRRIGSDVNRIISTIAGKGTASFSGDGGPATSATLSNPYTVFVDSVGVVYIGDNGNNRVRRVTTGGIISTVIGTDSTSYNGDQPGSSCNLNYPIGIVVDPSNGDIYVASYSHILVRVLTGSSGIVTVFAGNQNSAYSGENVAATSAGVYPRLLFLDTNNRLFITDGNNNRVRMTYPTSPTMVPTVSPSVVPSLRPTLIPSVIPSTLPSLIPTCIPSITPSCIPSVIPSTLIPSIMPSVGPSISPSLAPSVSPSVLPSVCPSLTPSVSPTISSSLNPGVSPSSVGPTVTPSVTPSVSPSVFSTTASPSTIRSSQNSIITIAGTGAASSTGTGGVAIAMTLYNPEGVWLSSIGTVYVVEFSGHCVRKFSYPNGIVVSVAGISGSSGSSGNSGPATSALLNNPFGIVVDNLSVVYIADYGNNRVRMVSVSGIIATIAGTGTASNTGDNGPASSATVYRPRGVWMDSLFQLYVVSNSGYTVRRIGSDVNRIISTIAGTGSNSFSGDGGPATSATLNNPTSVFVDSVGVFYIGDGSNHRVRRVTTGGIISTVIGTGSTSFNGDQPGTSSNLNFPLGVVVDPSNGDIYVAALNNYLVQVLTASSGIVSVFAGNQNSAYSGENVPATSAGVIPVFLFLDTNSCLFISDSDNNRVRMTYPTSPTMVPTVSPNIVPSLRPTLIPSVIPSTLPSLIPSSLPSFSPSCNPSAVSSTLVPSIMPSVGPSISPSLAPSVSPSVGPTVAPSVMPSCTPSVIPSMGPTVAPSVVMSVSPSVSSSLLEPSVLPIEFPTTEVPSLRATAFPSFTPSIAPSTALSSVLPTLTPSVSPSVLPSSVHFTIAPSTSPSMDPSVSPSLIPSMSPTTHPPSVLPSVLPTTTDNPSVVPLSALSSMKPSVCPSVPPSVEPTIVPSVTLSLVPTEETTICPSVCPSLNPSVSPSVFPPFIPSLVPSVITDIPFSVSFDPSVAPSARPSTVRPSDKPTLDLLVGPSFSPSDQPSVMPSSLATSQLPTFFPSEIPSALPSVDPSLSPSLAPSLFPTLQPSALPSVMPSVTPSVTPSLVPTVGPSVIPTMKPTACPSVLSTLVSTAPSITREPTAPTVIPSFNPSVVPTVTPSVLPSQLPSTYLPTAGPSVVPSQTPSLVVPSPLPTTQSPSAAPSTVDFYLSHPKASLPSNDSISVLGMSDQPFRIVIPFFDINSGSNGVVFDDVVLSKGTTASVSLIPGSALSVSLNANDGSINTYGNAVGFDSAMRSVSMLKDVNDDGHNDLIIGDPYAARCYVLFGTELGLTSMTQGFTIFGESEGDLTGWSVSDAGDVNNDTLHDIIIGAPFARGLGAVYVVYGRRSNNNFDVYLNNLTASQGFAVYGSQKSDYLGVSVSNAGDVNGDGCDDVIFGGVMTSQYFAGAAVVLYGGRSLSALVSLSQLTPQQGYKMAGVSYGYIGCSVSAAGDVNKDGLVDVIIGSSSQKSSFTATAYLVYGASTVTGDVLLTSLTASQGIKITGGGVFVGSAGDIDADGYSDVLVWSNYAMNSRVGLVLFSSVNQFSAPTRNPTIRPTLRSRQPSIRPTVKPSRLPTLRPTAEPTETPPSAEPIVSSSSPSSFPSSRPSIVTNEPSLAPSEPPTVQPSMEPSEHPSMHPTAEPSEAPTRLLTRLSAQQPSLAPFQRITRRPAGVPSASPSVLPALLSFNILEGNKFVNTTQGAVVPVVFYCNASGLVSIKASSSAGVTYIVTPRTDMEIVLWSFNVPVDLIDLTAFTSIKTFSAFKITAGSAIINLPNGQLIRIMNHQPNDITASNFILAYFNDDGDNRRADFILEMMQISIPLGLVLLVAIGLWQFYLWRQKKVAANVAVRRHIMKYSMNLEGEYITIKDLEDNQNRSDALSDFSVSSETKSAESVGIQYNAKFHQEELVDPLSSFEVSEPSHYEIDGNQDIPSPQLSAHSINSELEMEINNFSPAGSSDSDSRSHHTNSTQEKMSVASNLSINSNGDLVSHTGGF